MEQKRMLAIILAGIMALAACLTFYITRDKKEQEVGNTDAIRFKEEYESLNDKRDRNGNLYLSVSISNDNPVVYKNEAEILELFKDKTGIFYFGYNSDAWCRGIIEPLLRSMNDNNMDTLYYYQILDTEENQNQESYFYTPSVLTVLDGEIVKIEQKSEDESLEFNDEEKENLYNLYNEMIAEIKNGSCDDPKEEAGC